MQIKAINVTEISFDSVVAVHSFSTDPEGVKEAEEKFKGMARGNGWVGTEDELEERVEDGYWEQGDYQVFLTWSEGS